MKKMNDSDGKDVLAEIVEQRVAARRILCEKAIEAAARIANSGTPVPRWFAELAPLTKAERVIVLRALESGFAKEQ